MRRQGSFARTAVLAGILLIGLPSAATAAGGSATIPRATEQSAPTMLSASWGLNNGTSCPQGPTGRDNLPVTFNWFIRTSTIETADFVVTRDDGSTITPVCALQFPPDERNEHQTINLIGDFGDPAGARPVSVTLRGVLQGRPVSSKRWQDIPAGLTHSVDQIEGGPYIADAWILSKLQLKGDKNQCDVGKAFVRVAWSNGLTAYPNGSAIGPNIASSYRAEFTLPNGRTTSITPLAIGDLGDHSSVANEDNMHDLCLPGLQKGAKLATVRIEANQLQDPNGDPNIRQAFRAVRQ